jgi:hypothetical protein
MKRAPRGNAIFTKAVALALAEMIHLTGAARAADITSTWDGTANSWSDPSHWVNAPLAGSFPNNGNGGFTYDAAVGSGTANLAGTIAIQSLNFSGGTINGNGFALTTSQPLNWTAGTLGGTGTVFANGGLTISGSGGKGLNQTLSNASTATWTGSSGVFGTGTFTNQLGATFNAQATGAAFGVNQFNNAGTIIRSGTGNSFFGGVMTLNNTGTVQVLNNALNVNGSVTQSSAGVLTGGTWIVQGTLNLPGSAITTLGSAASVTLDGSGASFTQIDGLTTNAGSLSIIGGRTFTTTGASFDNSGTLTVGSGSTVTVNVGGTQKGAIVVNGGGNIVFSAGLQSISSPATFSGAGTLSLSGGTLDADTSWTAPAVFEWSGGTLSGGSSANVAGGSVLNISGASSKGLSQSLNNSGTTTWTGTSGVFGSGVFNNLPGATFIAQGTSGAFGVNQFTNGGTVIKSGTGGTNFGGVMNLNNTGTVQVTAGTFNINGTVTQSSAGTLTGGTWQVINATLNFPGSNLTTIGPAASVLLSGTSSAFTRINTLADNQGQFALAGARVFATTGPMANSGSVSADTGSIFTSVGALTWTGGSMGGAGTIVASAGASITGDVVKPGTGVFRVVGAFALTAGKKLDLTEGKMIHANGDVGTWTGSSYTGLTGLIKTGRNGNTLPLWDGVGIVTSQTTAISGNFHSIGIARASDVRTATISTTAIWAGQTITGTDVLVMYTYGGDATLDGKINIDDYVRIDSALFSGAKGWSNGDFNYDGKVNIDDYTTIIDANLGNQNGFVFPTGSGIGESISMVAVPEPTLLGLTLGGVTLLTRRRRPVASGTSRWHPLPLVPFLLHLVQPIDEGLHAVTSPERPGWRLNCG